MKMQALVNKYRIGQARPEDRRHLDDDAERKEFDTWWQNNAHKYKDEHPNVYDNFKAFYEDDGAEATEAPQGVKVTPDLVIDAMTIEKIAEGLKKAGYELRKVSDNAPKSWDDLPVLLTPEEAQAVLRISRPTFFRMVKEGKLAGAKKQGGSWLINKEVLRASTQNQVGH